MDLEPICEYCGERLIGPRPDGHTFIAPDRKFPAPRSTKNDVTCNDGECLNAAGYVTRHNPIGYPLSRES